jgi:hypothetical protein
MRRMPTGRAKCEVEMLGLACDLPASRRLSRHGVSIDALRVVAVTTALFA